MLHEKIARPAAETIRLTELLGAFTYALDLTEGQPQGHCLRSAYIAARLAEGLGLSATDAADVFYAAMLKDLGCSSNAARLHELYQADDLTLKHDYKTIAPGIPATLQFVFAKTAVGAPLLQRVAAIANILRNGDSVVQEMIVARCTRGSDVARELRFSEDVCRGIYHLDEKWDGSGRPDGLAGSAIPLASRIALLAQIADVFHHQGGPEAAVFEVTRRAGSWLDPELAGEFAALDSREFWNDLASPGIETIVAALAPQTECEVDEDFLDAVTAAFGRIIDAKSPFTAGHSERVSHYTGALGAHFDMLPVRLRQLRRAAALHDVGKLGVSSAILEKPGKLEEREWIVMRDHAAQTQAILSRIGPLAELASLASAHHERLDGKGYPLGLDDRVLSRETRIITLCDFYDALTADRPYRAAMPQDQALAIIGAEVGKAVDGDCFAALRTIVET